MSSRAWLVALCVFTASAFAPGRFVAMPTSARQRVAPSIVMGRKFENNKLKMAKTALAYAKKARSKTSPSSLEDLTLLRRPSPKRPSTLV